jgi:trk system potassium uptake protein TrkH
MSAVVRITRSVRRDIVGVDVGGSLNLVGSLLELLGLAFLIPTAIALGYGESPWSFVVGGAITSAAGFVLERLTEGRERIGPREGFFVVAVTWAAAAFAMSLPYLFSGSDQLSSPLDAFFEAMSGMTTTGASVLTDIEALDKSMLMWRQLTQWLGGMGIIVLALAVLPRLRIGGRQLLESELPGPEVEPLATTIRATARRLWVLYGALTAAAALVYASIGWAGLDDRMNLFEAVAHAFTTMPTGGFSTQARSAESFSAATQWAMVVFMLFAGANFALIYRALRGRGRPWRDSELRLYLLLVALASVALIAKLAGRGVFEGEEAVRQAVFQVVSTMTTTGYASADFSEWPIFATMVLVFLMFIGGSAGSTGGGMKVVRVLVLAKLLRRELDQAVHREAVVPVRVNKLAVDEHTVRGIAAFVLLYVVLFLLGSAALVVSEAANTARVDLTWPEAISAAATTIGNVGPGLGFLGPMGSFDPFSGASKGILIGLMWLGRLELIPVAVLFTRAYWRS